MYDEGKEVTGRLASVGTRGGGWWVGEGACLSFCVAGKRSTMRNVARIIGGAETFWVRRRMTPADVCIKEPKSLPKFEI